ncbi:MAG: DUF4065 domain-containing protein [Deltaproteobacteria bacterium]|nr:DUF4065 domain-containing protein [Deltaproteobacteria bacterium]
MKGLCPNCEKVSELEKVKTKEMFNVRGESIEIDVEYYKCLDCGNEFEDPSLKNDPLEKAYREYRNRHNMVQPEEVRTLRKHYGLTQRELSKLIGWGGATLSRYENGALQDTTHDRFLQLLKNPENLQRLILKNGEFLADEKKESILAKLSAEIGEVCTIPEFVEEHFGKYEPEIDSGFNKLNLDKLFEAVKFFASDGVFKTKLCKLLFYADFKHFKDYAVSITGAKYVHLPHGPVPDKYEHYFAILIHDEKVIQPVEVDYADFIGEKFITEVDPDTKIFKTSELEILGFVKSFFKNYSATAIRDFSHNEKGYKETNKGDMISYKYADDLQI